MKNKLALFVIVTIAITAIIIFVYDGNKKYNDMLSRITYKVYVALEGSGKIAVIDLASNRVFKRIDLFENKNGQTINYMPHNVQVAPNNKSVWVTASATEKKKMSFGAVPIVYADEGSDAEAVGGGNYNDQVIVIDPFSDQIIKRIEIGKDLGLSHIDLTPDGVYAITASQKKSLIYKINTVTFEIEKIVATQTGAGPHGLRISTDGKMAYLAMLGGKSMGILDIAKMNLSYVPLKGSAVQTGVSPDGKYAMASVYESKSLAVYDTASAKLNYVDLPNGSMGPVQIYPTPDSRYVYVADQGYYFDQPAGELIFKIDLLEMNVVQTIKGGVAPHGVVVSKDGKFVYITNLLGDDVSVIDTGTGKEITKIKVGEMPNGISLWHSEE